MKWLLLKQWWKKNMHSHINSSEAPTFKCQIYLFHNSNIRKAGTRYGKREMGGVVLVIWWSQFLRLTHINRERLQKRRRYQIASTPLKCAIHFKYCQGKKVALDSDFFQCEQHLMIWGWDFLHVQKQQCSGVFIFRSSGLWLFPFSWMTYSHAVCL